MPKIFGGGGLTAPVAATNIADGSVSNTEFQYLNNATSEIQSQLNSKLPLAGGTLTGAVEFSSAFAAPTNGIGPNGSGNVVVNGSGCLKLQRAGVDHWEAYGGGNIAYQPIYFSGSQTNGFGNSAVIMWRDSSGHLNINVGSGACCNMTCNGTTQARWGEEGLERRAKLATRAASTAISICPVATGDIAIVDVQSTTVASCRVMVDASGTVTLYSPTGGTVDANIVNSSSPAAGEIGIYISAGVLYFKGGSSYAGKMAAFPNIGKA